MKDKSIAALLALFLGGFGAHRFYLNQNTLGFIYLIFCWTGIPTIIGFIDFVLFLMMEQYQFDCKYNTDSETYNFRDLGKLFDLKVKGIITESDYIKLKNKVIHKC